jgi:hypothetical protein
MGLPPALGAPAVGPLAGRQRGTRRRRRRSHRAHQRGVRRPAPRWATRSPGVRKIASWQLFDPPPASRARRMACAASTSPRRPVGLTRSRSRRRFRMASGASRSTYRTIAGGNRSRSRWAVAQPDVDVSSFQLQAFEQRQHHAGLAPPVAVIGDGGQPHRALRIQPQRGKRGRVPSGIVIE